MGRIAVAAVLGSLAACDGLLKLHDITPISDAPPSDVPPPDAPPPDVLSICVEDDFSSSTIDPNKWNPYADVPASIDQVNGQLVVTLGTTSAIAYAGVIATQQFDLTDMRTELEVDLVPSASMANAELSWVLDAQDDLTIYTDGAVLNFEQQVAGQRDTLPIKYDAALHKYWRLRHDRGAAEVALETSADRQTWFTNRTIVPAFSLAALSVEINAGTYASIQAPGQAKFDNFVMAGTCP